MTTDSNAGRPSKYDPSFCELAVSLGKEGKSHAQIAVRIGVVRDTLYEWAREHQEFSDAMSLARECALDWWEEQAQRGIWAGKEFNAAAWNKSVTARFPVDYGERKAVEVSGPGGGAQQHEHTVTVTADEAYKQLIEGN